MKKISIIFIAVIFTIGIYFNSVNAAWTPTSRIQKFQCLSTDSKPTTADMKAGFEVYEKDTGATYIYDGSTWNLLNIRYITDPDSLTSAGVSKGTYIKGWNQLTAVVCAKDSADGVDIVWTLEGYITGMGWSNLNPNGSKNLVSVSADSSQLSTYTEIGSLDSVRIRNYKHSQGDTLIYKFSFVNEFLR